MKVSANRIALSLVVLVSLALPILVIPSIDAAVQAAKPKKFQVKPQKREKTALRRGGKDYKVKKGAEVAAKVKKLKESNKSVRAALKVFEDKKRMPKIDQSFSINGSLGSLKAGLNTRGGVFQNVSYEQQSSISGTYVDLIFVPVLSLDMEWQGAVIADLYDNSNNIVGEYVAVSVLVMPDANLYAWDEVYEAPVYDGVLQPAIAEPWMFTNVDLGVPLDQQQVSADVNQRSSRETLNVIQASYAQGGPARIRAWANCTFGWCGGAGVSCIGSSVWSADALNSSCFASGCGDYAIGCSWETIWQ
jgi:hypothetical protein